MTEKGSDAQMTDEQAMLMNQRYLSDVAAMKAEDELTAQQPEADDEPDG